MAWLQRATGERIVPCERAESFADRSRGLLGRDGVDGALLLDPASSVHTFGMRFAIDVAFCDRRMQVLDIVTMPRNRLGRPRVRGRVVLEAEAGSFARWGVRVGDRLAVVDD
jgi:uncharacterized membrane protein (UPF0127 family)